MSENKVGAAVWIAAGQAIQLAANFLLLKLLTTQLSVSSFGYYSLCMTIVLFARQVLYDPVSIVVAKNCAVTNAGDQSVSDGFWVVRYLTDRAFILFLALGSLFLALTEASGSNQIFGLMALGCFLYLAANGALGIYVNVLNSISRRRFASVFLIVDSISKITLVYLVSLMFADQPGHVLLAVAVSATMVIVLLRQSILVGFPDEGALRKGGYVTLKNTMLMSVPLYLPSFFTAFKGVGDRWFLAAFIGVDELAAFSVLLQIGYLPMLLSIGVLQTFVAPHVYRLCALEDGKGHVELTRYLKDMSLKIFFFSCLAIVVSLAFSDLAFKLLVGSDYQSFSTFLPIFVVSGAFAAFSGVLQLAVIGSFDTRSVAKLMVVSVITGVVGSCIFIFVWGFVGAVTGLVFGSAATALIYWFALRRRSLT